MSLSLSTNRFHSQPELDSPDDDITSAAFWEDNHNRDLHSGTQVYNSDHSKCSVQDLGKPLPHRWANQSTTGEAVFIDDQRLCKGTAAIIPSENKLIL